MIQDLFINYGAKLIELQQLEPNGTVAHVLDRVYQDGDLDSNDVEQLWQNPELRTLIEAESVDKDFIRQFPYATYLKNRNNLNFLRIFLAQKAFEYAPADTSQVSDTTTTTTDSIITNESTDDFRVDLNEEITNFVPTNQENQNIEYSLNVQQQESIMRNKSVQRQVRPFNSNSQVQFKHQTQAQVGLNTPVASSNNASSSAAKAAIAASVCGLGAASSLPLLSIFFS